MEAIRAGRVEKAVLARRLVTKAGGSRPTAPTYVVRKGDTPAVIAKRLGVPVAVLMKGNGIKDARRLRPGMTLRLPGPEKASPVRVADKRRTRVSKAD